jgi:hypothetical protein
MIELEDLKVVGANVLCFITIKTVDLNVGLQTILLLATIIYTFVRIINECKKYLKNR